MNKLLVGLTEEGTKVVIITHEYQSFGVDNFQDKFNIASFSSWCCFDVNNHGKIEVCESSPNYIEEDILFVENLFKEGFIFKSLLKRRYIEDDVIMCNVEFLPFIKHVEVEKDILSMRQSNSMLYFYGVN